MSETQFSWTGGKCRKTQFIGRVSIASNFCVELTLIVHGITPDGRWRNILHIGHANLEQSPAIWLYPNSYRLRFHLSEVAGNQSRDYDPDMELEPNRPYHIKLECQHNMLSVFIDGVLKKAVGNVVHITRFEAPVWCGNPWFDAANGTVKNLSIYVPAQSGATTVPMLASLPHVHPVLYDAGNDSDSVNAVAASTSSAESAPAALNPMPEEQAMHHDQLAEENHNESDADSHRSNSSIEDPSLSDSEGDDDDDDVGHVNANSQHNVSIATEQTDEKAFFMAMVHIKKEQIQENVETMASPDESDHDDSDDDDGDILHVTTVNVKNNSCQSTDASTNTSMDISTNTVLPQPRESCEAINCSDPHQDTGPSNRTRSMTRARKKKTKRVSNTTQVIQPQAIGISTDTFQSDSGNCSTSTDNTPKKRRRCSRCGAVGYYAKTCKRDSNTTQPQVIQPQAIGISTACDSNSNSTDTFQSEKSKNHNALKRKCCWQQSYEQEMEPLQHVFSAEHDGHKKQKT